MSWSGERCARLLIAVAWGAGMAPGAGAQQPPAPRNVVFILSDDHRYDFMSFMPSAPAWLQTPNLDRMAATRTHLRNAFVTTSLCSPSRASILTGKYAHRHGVVDNTSPVPPNTVFFPQLLQRAGYRTAFIGKWHMGEAAASDDPRPGFDHWISFQGQGVYLDPTHLGLADMGGNVWQWTGDWFRPYAGRDEPYTPGAGASRVQRGGSFLCTPSFCHGYRVSARSHASPETALFHVGFRCAKDLAPRPAP